MPAPLNVEYPQAGLHRGTSFQSQPPYTSPDMANMRSRDSIALRNRGGSRPLLIKAFAEQLGNGNPIRMMAVCRSLDTSAVRVFTDSFDNPSNALDPANWTAAAWATDGLPFVANGVAASDQFGAVKERGAVLTSISNIDTGATRMIGGNSPSWFSEMGNPAPTKLTLRLDTTNSGGGDSVGIAATVGHVAGNTDGTKKAIQLYVAGQLVETKMVSVTTTPPRWFELRIAANKEITVYYASSTPRIIYNATGYTPIANKAAFDLECVTQGNEVGLNDIRVEYVPTSASVKPPRFLVASAGGHLYSENILGQMIRVNYSSHINAGDQQNPRHPLAGDILLDWAARFQKLYIADYGQLYSSTAGTTSSLGGSANQWTTRLAVSGLDWTSSTVDGLAVGDYVRITAGPSTVGDYRVQTVTAGYIIIRSNLTANPFVAGTANHSFSVWRGPKVYDAATNTLSPMLPETTMVPPCCSIVEAWMDRLAWAGDLENPHRLYLSKAGDPIGYSYGTGLVGGAVAYSAANSTAEIGDRIKGMAGHRDDYLVIGGETQSFLQRGDPTRGGQIDTIATIALLDKKAWTSTPDGRWVGVTPSGLYRIPPTPSAIPEPMSESRLPLEFKSIDPSLYDVMAENDDEAGGIRIFVTPKVPGNTTHWFYNLTNEAFEPDTFDATIEPTACVAHRSQGEPSRVFLGCRDGYIRKFSRAATTDDGLPVNSYVVFGPFALSSPNDESGRIYDVTVQLARGSQPVRVWVATGKSAEDAMNSGFYELSSESVPLTDGPPRTYQAYRTGQVAYVKLTGVGYPWAMELLTIRREPLGKQR